MTGLRDAGMLKSHCHHTAVSWEWVRFCEGVWVDTARAFSDSGAKTNATANATAIALRARRRKRKTGADPGVVSLKISPVPPMIGAFIETSPYFQHPSQRGLLAMFDPPCPCLRQERILPRPPHPDISARIAARKALTSLVAARLAIVRLVCAPVKIVYSREHTRYENRFPPRQCLGRTQWRAAGETTTFRDAD